jgi:aspartate/methionine/tyrosine aminotransferase
VRYTSSLGVPELREAISGCYADRFGVAVRAGRVVVISGASGALLLALSATVDRDHLVLLADPGYPCNRNIIRMCEGVAVGLPVGAGTDYQLTAGLVADGWSPGTRAVLLASPSNPTGTMVASGELAAIVAEADRRGGVCFVDEIYASWSPPAATSSSRASGRPASASRSCPRAPSTSTPAPTPSISTACASPAASSTRPASPPFPAATSATTNPKPTCASPTLPPSTRSEKASAA